MTGLLKLLLLAAYTFSVFFISSPWLLGGLALCNITLMLLGRIAPAKALRNLAVMLPFIAFAALINLLLGDLREMVLVAARLLLVCNITFIFRQRTGSMELAKSLELLCTPLKLFRVNPRDIGLMVSIAVAFIPVLQRELADIVRALSARGMRLTPRNVRYVLRPFLTGIFKRTGEIELALRAKGYDQGSDPDA